MAPEQPAETFSSIVASIVSRLRLAAALNMEFVHRPEGARSLAELLEHLARQLDSVGKAR